MRWRSIPSTQGTTAPLKLLLPLSYTLLGCIIGISLTNLLQHHGQLIAHSCTVRRTTVETDSPRSWLPQSHKPSQMHIMPEGEPLASQQGSKRDVGPGEPGDDEELQATIKSQEPGDDQELSLTAQLQRKFARLPRIHEIPAGSDVFLTYSNGHYSKLMLNAAALVADLGYPIIVLAFDKATEDTCETYGLPFMRSGVRMDTEDFRQDRCTYLSAPRARAARGTSQNHPVSGQSFC